MRRAAAVAALLVLAAGCTSAEEPTRERHLVFTRGIGTPGQAIWIADASGDNARKLVRGSNAYVSPDGRVIAVIRGGDLWTVGADGSEVKRLPWRGDFLEWVPDGKRYLAHRDRALVVIDLADGDAATLDPRLPHRALYSWSFSPDGRSLVYGRAERPTSWAICGDRLDLYRVDLDGSSRRRLTRDGQSTYPVWTRDGIVFSHRPGPLTPQSRFENCLALGIWKLGPDGSGVRPIVRRAPRRYCCFGGFYGLRPYAALSDRRLLVAVRSEWGDEAALLDVRTKRIRNLRVHIEDVSRDGRWIVGTQGGAEYPFDIAVASVGGRRRVLAHGRVCCADWNR